MNRAVGAFISMNIFMKTFIFGFIAVVCLVALVFASPIAVMWHQLAAFAGIRVLIEQEFELFAGVELSEEGGGTPKEQAQSQIVTVTLPQDALKTMIEQTLAEHALPCMTIREIKTAITPETISIQVASACELFGRQLYAIKTLSEWEVRGDAGVNIRPAQIYSTVLTTINWAKYWKYLAKNADADGWQPFFSSDSSLAVQDILLQEREIAINLAL